MAARGWTEQQGETGGERVMEAFEAGRSSDKLIHSPTTMDSKVRRSPKAKKDSQSLSLGFAFGFSICSPGQL